MSKKEKLVCGLDIGTTKVCMIIGRAQDDGGLEILSTGYALSAGLTKGRVVDLEEAAASIRKAAEEAELKSGISVDWVTVGISGDHVQSFACKGAVPVEGKHNEVAQEDVTQVINAARSIPIPAEREVIHVLPQEFFLDGRGGIHNPVGLTGSRLDVTVHVVTCESFLIQNLINAVNRAQMRAGKIVLQQLASAEAVLTPDEKDLGCVLVDIGGGTTDIAIFLKKSILNSPVLPVGGDHFTRDLAIGLRTPMPAAEALKKEAGSVALDEIAEDEELTIAAVGHRQSGRVSRRLLCQILRDRGMELMELVREEILRVADREQLTAGVVITGGGSLLHGMLELAEEVLEMPVRRGLPHGIPGLPEDLAHPVYATAIGLSKLGALAGGDWSRRQGKPGGQPWIWSRFLSWVGH